MRHSQAQPPPGETTHVKCLPRELRQQMMGRGLALIWVHCCVLSRCIGPRKAIKLVRCGCLHRATSWKVWLQSRTCATHPDFPHPQTPKTRFALSTRPTQTSRRFLSRARAVLGLSASSWCWDTVRVSSGFRGIARVCRRFFARSGSCFSEFILVPELALRWDLGDRQLAPLVCPRRGEKAIF